MALYKFSFQCKYELFLFSSHFLHCSFANWCLMRPLHSNHDFLPSIQVLLLIDIELSYINTNHEDFIGFAKYVPSSRHLFWTPSYSLLPVTPVSAKILWSWIITCCLLSEEHLWFRKFTKAKAYNSQPSIHVKPSCPFRKFTESATLLGDWIKVIYNLPQVVSCCASVWCSMPISDPATLEHMSPCGGGGCYHDQGCISCLPPPCMQQYSHSK